MYTPGTNRWPRAVPAAVSTQRNLAAAKPALWDGCSLLFIVSWLAGRGEGDDEACGEVDVDCPFRPGLIWKCTAILRFLILLFFPGGCHGEEQEQELVGAGGTQRLELGGADGDTAAPGHDICAQTPALGQGVLGGLVGSRGGAVTSVVLHKPWGLPGDAAGSSRWSPLPGKASAVHSTHGGDVSQCFPVKVHVHGEEELLAWKGGEGGISR